MVGGGWLVDFLLVFLLGSGSWREVERQVEGGGLLVEAEMMKHGPCLEEEEEEEEEGLILALAVPAVSTVWVMSCLLGEGCVQESGLVWEPVLERR